MSDIFSKMPAMVYRPMMNPITGSVNATLLLNQIVYLWQQNKKRPFHMFMEPCPGNPLYRRGMSWTEIMGFGSFEFKSALEKIARRSPAGSVQQLLPLPDETRPVIYWTDRARLTWYDVDEATLSNAVNRALLNAKTAPSKARKSALDNSIIEKENSIDIPAIAKPPKNAAQKAKNHEDLEANSPAGAFLFQQACVAAGLSGKRCPSPIFPNAIIKKMFDDLEERVGPDEVCRRIKSAYTNLGFVSTTNIIKYITSTKWEERPSKKQGGAATEKMVEEKLREELEKIYGPTDNAG